MVTVRGCATARQRRSGRKALAVALVMGALLPILGCGSGSSTAADGSSPSDAPTPSGVSNASAALLPRLPTLIARVAYPADAGVVDVRRAPFFAVGDGVADDTEALQAALCGVRNGVYAGGGSVNRIVYIPNGTYRVSATLNWCSSFKRYTQIQGESRDGAIIRLADSAAGFTDSAHPKAVFSMVGDLPGQPVTGAATSFRNAIYDVTIDVGKGNPGAKGIDFLSNNQGGVRNVVLTAEAGSGKTGIDMTTPVQGPSLLKNIDIQGFETGMSLKGETFTITMEDIHVSGQRVAGILNDGMRVSLLGLSSSNTVPTLKDSNLGAHWVVVDANLDGNGTSNAAIETEGFVYLQRANLRNYGAGVRWRGQQLVSGSGAVAEFASIGARDSDGVAHMPVSLGLPIKRTPESPPEDASKWISAAAFGARSGLSNYNQASKDGDDATAAIQAAIDSGATTVYLPNGIYVLRDTLHLRGALTRIEGMDSVLKIAPPLSTSGKPVFSIEDGVSQPVVIERLDTDFASEGHDCTLFSHATKRALILRNVSNNRCASIYNSTPAADGAELYVEDTVGTDWRIGAIQVWMRQVDPEGANTATTAADAYRKMTLTGTTAWIFGMKTEGTGTIVDARAGAKVEVLGGWLGGSRYLPPAQPAFVSSNSTLSVVASENSDPYAVYSILGQFSNGASSAAINRRDLPARFGGALLLMNSASQGAAMDPKTRDGSRVLDAEDWDMAIDAGNLSTCRGGVPDLTAFGLPPQAGTTECLYGGNWIGFKSVVFDKKPASVSIRFASSFSEPGQIEVRRDRPDGPLVASTPVHKTATYLDPRVIGRVITGIEEVTVPALNIDPGQSDLYVLTVGSRSKGSVASVDSIRFNY